MRLCLINVKKFEMKLAQNLKFSGGILSKDDRKASQGYVDIKNITAGDLKELIERQEKLLKNRAFIAKLPDKGEKISLFKEQLEKELKRRETEFGLTCELLSKLSLTSGKSEDIEWNDGKINESKPQFDSDDDSDIESDPLKLLATHSGTVGGIIRQREKTKYSLTDSKELPYAEKLCEKYGNATNTKERFRPNQLKDSRNLFVKSAENLKKKLGDKWEVTQAIPPVPIHKDAVFISLSESLKLQKEQAEKLREIERNQAAAKLIRAMNLKMSDKLPVNNITEYREAKDVFDECAQEDEGEECYDSEEEREKGRSVCYSIEGDEQSS